MPTYVIYARKSSESEDRQVLSIDSQVRELRLIAERERIPIAETLIETMSAKAPGRPVFGALMRRVNQGAVQGIFCWKMDRLSRNPLDSGVLLQAQADGKLERIITSDGTKTADSNDRLMGTFELAFATKFIDDLRANTKRGLRERLARGWTTSVPPIGYLNDVVKKTIVVDEQRFPLVRRMWDALLSGSMRPDQIRTMANDDWALRTPQRQRVGGKPLSRSHVYRIFTNPFYMGVIALRDGRSYPGAHAPMITREEFARAREILGRTGRARPVRHEFAFTGLMKCGNCGAAITAEEHIKPSGRRYVYYHCTRRRMRAEKCREAAVSETEVVGQIAEPLRRLTIPTEILDWLRAKVEGLSVADRHRQNAVSETLKQALAAVEREQANLLTLQLRDLVTIELYAAKSRELTDRRITLQERIADVERSNAELSRRIAEVLDFASAVRERFIRGTGVQQRELLEALGSNYRLAGKKVHFQLETPLAVLADANGSSNWLRVVDDLRTWALNTTDYFKVPDFVHERTMPESVVAV